MKRYPAYDPPEYLAWKADGRLLESYRDTLARNPDRAALVAELGDATLLGLYRGLLRFRLHDIALKRWVKRGVISKAWLGTGEEAVTVGVVHALRRGPGGDGVAPNWASRWPISCARISARLTPPRAEGTCIWGTSDAG